MTRLEELQTELSQITARRQETQDEMRAIKAIQRNEYRRQIRARLRDEGFTLKDAIASRAPIADLTEATWYTSAFTPLGEDSLMIFPRDYSTRTTSLEVASKWYRAKVMMIYPGKEDWREIHESDLDKIKGLKK